MSLSEFKALQRKLEELEKMANQKESKPKDAPPDLSAELELAKRERDEIMNQYNRSMVHNTLTERLAKYTLNESTPVSLVIDSIEKRYPNLKWDEKSKDVIDDESKLDLHGILERYKKEHPVVFTPVKAPVKSAGSGFKVDPDDVHAQHLKAYEAFMNAGKGQ